MWVVGRERSHLAGHLCTLVISSTGAGSAGDSGAGSADVGSAEGAARDPLHEPFDQDLEELWAAQERGEVLGPKVFVRRDMGSERFRG